MNHAAADLKTHNESAFRRRGIKRHSELRENLNDRSGKAALGRCGDPLHEKNDVTARDDVFDAPSR
jgi:hypothetical protein